MNRVSGAPVYYKTWFYAMSLNLNRTRFGPIFNSSSFIWIFWFDLLIGCGECGRSLNVASRGVDGRKESGGFQEESRTSWWRKIRDSSIAYGTRRGRSNKDSRRLNSQSLVKGFFNPELKSILWILPQVNQNWKVTAKYFFKQTELKPLGQKNNI